MAVSFDKFTEIVEMAAPLACAYPWDNSGRNVRVTDTVHKVMIALDVTEQVIAQAEEQGCDTILSHHPLLLYNVAVYKKRIHQPAPCPAGRP